MNYVPVGKDGCMFAIPLHSPFLGSWLDCIPPNGSHDRVWLINYGGNDCIYFQIWFLKRSSVTFFHCLSAGCKESRGELGSEGMVETLEPWMLQSRASCHLSWIIVSVINCNCLILLRLLIIVFFVVVQSCLTLWDPMDCKHARLPCTSQSARACSNSGPLSRWCHPTISSSLVPFSSCLLSCPASGSFPMSPVLHIRWPNYWSFSFSISPFNE